MAASQTALITGAGRGIGRALAVELAGRGYSLAITARSAEELEQTAEICRLAGAVCECFPADLTSPGGVELILGDVVGRFGGLDVLINNAGMFHWGSAMDADPDAWDSLIDLNLKSTIRLTRLALPHIQRSSAGAVIFVASMAGKRVFPMNAAYIASKHAIVGFAGAVFEDVRKFNIKVSAICPGLVNAGAAREIPLPASGFEKMLQPEDVAAAVRFVLESPPNCCPVEISLLPQLDPWLES